MEKSGKIFIAGRYGMVGSAVERALRREGYTNIGGLSHTRMDLCSQFNVERYFGINRPDYVFLTAAVVGGIYANSKGPANFIYSNLEIQNNIIHSCMLYGVKKLLFLGSSCIYPKHAKQPIKESELLSGPLEPTNDAYAIAKIAGIKMCQAYREQYGTDFICAMPTNLYGKNDNYHYMNSHVIPALIRKIHDAKVSCMRSVKLWGTGKPLREFLYVDDLADACVMLMKKYTGKDIVNVGSGGDITIARLAKMISLVIGYKGEIEWDTSMPDGTPRKLLDISKITALGWKPQTTLADGLEMAYYDFCHNDKLRK